MACNHCFVNATPAGDHITNKTFLQALNVAVELGDPFVLLSGGEPTEHPRIVELIVEASKLFGFVAVASNGMWLHNPAATAELLSTEAHWQITNDARFYPLRLPKTELETPMVTYVYQVQTLQRLGRWRGPSNRLGPSCFNLLSAVRRLRSFTLAVGLLRQFHKFCTPSIDIDGTIRAGESTECYPLGSVWSAETDLTKAAFAHDCDRCGLHHQLPEGHLRAIGKTEWLNR